MAESATICPGCGLSLPAETGSPIPSLNASPECWRLYGEVTGAAMVDRALAGFHQLTVDTYPAQHSRPDGPPIATAFALIGLHLALDENWSGVAVRDAHQRLAEDSKLWPVFRPPASLGTIDRTILDVAVSASANEHRDALERWARAVWSVWRVECPGVETLLSDRRMQVSRRARGTRRRRSGASRSRPEGER